MLGPNVTQKPILKTKHAPIMVTTPQPPAQPRRTSGYDSETRLVAVAHKLTEAVLGLDAEEEYGTTGRETTGGVIMASLARALVSVEKEIRDAQKAAKEMNATTDSMGRVLMIAPEIPRKVHKPT